jgi:hypothetical protein
VSGGETWEKGGCMCAFSMNCPIVHSGADARARALGRTPVCRHNLLGLSGCKCAVRDCARCCMLDMPESIWLRGGLRACASHDCMLVRANGHLLVAGRVAHYRKVRVDTHGTGVQIFVRRVDKDSEKDKRQITGK